MFMLSHTGAVGDLKRDLLNRKSKGGKTERLILYVIFSIFCGDREEQFWSKDFL